MTDVADFAALCAAIDEGCDDALALRALADWLCDAGDAGDVRAAGLRRLMVTWTAGRRIGYRPAPGNRRTAAGWWYWSLVGTQTAEVYPDSALGDTRFSRLTRVAGDGEREQWPSSKGYPSRSAAFLALAEALAE